MTPWRRRVTRPRRNPVQTAPSSAEPMSSPRISRCPSALQAVATRTAVLQIRRPRGPSSAARRSSQTDTGLRPVASGGHQLIQLDADPRDLALGHAVDAQLAGDIAHPPGRDPSTYHCMTTAASPLGATTRLQQRREVAALARHPQPCAATRTAPSWTRPACSSSTWILKALHSRMMRWSPPHHADDRLPSVAAPGIEQIICFLCCSPGFYTTSGTLTSAWTGSA